MTSRLALSFAALVAALVSAEEGPAHGAELNCLIEPHVVITLSTPVEGIVETVTVDRGDLVRKDQVLATLESSLERATVAMARARAEQESAIKSNQSRLEFGLRRFVRAEELFKQEIISEREMDEAETQKVLAEFGLMEAQENKRLAELELERATAALALKTIRSPISGVVVERLLSPGELARLTPILKLAQLDPLRVEVFAPVSLLGKVAVGMKAQVMPEAPVNGVHPARVTVADRVVDAASGTFGVRLVLPNPDYRLPAGLRCRVRFLQEVAPGQPPGSW